MPQGVENGGVKLVQRPVHATGQDGIVGALAAQGPVAQFGGEAGVALVQAVMADAGRKHQVGVGVLGGYRAQDFKSHQPRRVRAAGALCGSVLGEAPLGAAVTFAALGVAWLESRGPPLPRPLPRCRPCHGRLHYRRTRSFEHHAFK